MATEVMTSPQSYQLVNQRVDFNWIQSIALKKAHPRAQYLSAIGLVWSIFYLWNHNMPMGVIMFLMFQVLSLLSVTGASAPKMSQTTLGKLALLRLEPLNLALQLVGVVLLIYGIWYNSILLFCGISMLLLGHLVGWAKVNPNFATSVEKE